MTPPDERHGAPSASGMLRLHHCPGSFQMERAHGKDETTEDAASGTRIHAVLAGLADESTLSAAEMETKDMCAAQTERVILEWTQAAFIPSVIYERRLGLTADGSVVDVTPDSKEAFIFTGQADLVAVEGDRALVIDDKTGRGEQEPAQDNPQLASLAVLVALRHGVKSVRVAIVQPWAGPPTVADYDANALALANAWLIATLEAARCATQADLRPGAHCQWCKAKHACPALQTAAVREVERIQPMSIAGLPPKEQTAAMWARALALTPQQHAAAYRGLEIVKRYIHAIEATFKQRVEAGEIPGFSLREKKGRRSISDVGTVFARANAHGVTAEDFTAECSLPLGSLNDLLRKATKAKGKALETIAAQCLEGCTDTGKPSFEVVENNQLEGGE